MSIYSFYVTGTQKAEKGLHESIAASFGTLSGSNRTDAAKAAIRLFKKEWPGHKHKIWDVRLERRLKPINRKGSVG
jgi:hypothetical protein